MLWGLMFVIFIIFVISDAKLRSHQPFSKWFSTNPWYSFDQSPTYIHNILPASYPASVEKGDDVICKGGENMVMKSDPPEITLPCSLHRKGLRTTSL